MKVKLLMDMSFVDQGKNLKEGMIVKTVKPPKSYENSWGIWVKGRGAKGPIRLRNDEYEIVEA